MTQNNTAELILQKWTASLASKDRTTKGGAPANFDELFSELKSAGITFNDAHAMLPRAVKAHEPNSYVKKMVWEKNKRFFEGTQQQFIEEWVNALSIVATEAFFANYPLKTNEDDDGEPKVYGNMSEAEYKRQRKYADNFPRINTDDLIRQMKDRKDLSGDLENVLGDKNE
jgi:hypothetical protein